MVQSRGAGCLLDTFSAGLFATLSPQIAAQSEPPRVHRGRLHAGDDEIPVVGCWSGRAEALTAIGRNFGMLENQTPRILGVVAQESAVRVMGHETGRVKATGRDYSVHWVQWYTFRSGSLVRVLQIFDNQAIAPAFLNDPTLPR